MIERRQNRREEGLTEADKRAIDCLYGLGAGLIVMVGLTAALLLLH